MHLAERNIEALGQVIRNFSTTLPAAMKVAVIRATYELGLRTMSHLLTEVVRYLEKKDPTTDEKLPWTMVADTQNITEIREEMGKLLLVMGKIVSVHYCKKISTSVGVSDNELAYQRAMDSMSASNAISLIDITIHMEHSRSFPEAKVKQLFENLRSNPFALGILQFLIAMHLLLYKVEPSTRARMAKLAGYDPYKLDRASLELRKEL